MSSRFIRASVGAACLFVSSFALVLAAEPLRDDEGRKVELRQPALRIVSLAPSLTEIAFAAGVGSSLVGASAYSDYPAEARKLPQVADASGISWESLLALKPDLVLAWKSGTRPSDISRLEGLGVKVFVIEVKQLADVPRALRVVGKLAGRSGTAESAADQFQIELTRLRASNAQKPAIKAFFEISSIPLMTINRDHVISEMISLCGGENVFGDSPSLVSEPSREELLVRAPDAILFGQTAGGKARTKNAAYEGLAAAQERRMFGITADYAFRPGPRLLWATGEICATLDRARESLKMQKGRH